MEKAANKELLEEIRKSLSRIEACLSDIRAQVSRFEGIEEPTFDIDDDIDTVAIPESEPAIVSEPVAQAASEPVSAPAVEAAPEPVSAPAVEPTPEQEPIPVTESEPESEPLPEESSESFAWKTDIPGSPVRNILSAISLNDRLLFINVLFEKNPVKFQTAISALNSLSSFAEAEAYILGNFPSWKMSSEAVYRFMMAVRRKLG